MPEDLDFLCWVCLPRNEEFKERARALQMGAAMQREAGVVSKPGLATLGSGGKLSPRPGDGVGNGMEFLGMASDDSRDAGGGGGGRRGRRQYSPGNERKRRSSAVHVDHGLGAGLGVGSTSGTGTGKRKRRGSVAQHNQQQQQVPPSPLAPPPLSMVLSSPGAGSSIGNLGANGTIGASSTATQPNKEEEQQQQHVDVDNSNEKPWQETYVQVSEDIIPSDETRMKLRRQAQNWRGVTAVLPSSSPNPSASSSSSSAPNPLPPAHPITIKQIPPHAAYNPLLAHHTNPDVLPPTYSVHTTLPIPKHDLITPFVSSITPSSKYILDPLNAYAHLGMPKPYVHLVGRPLDVALDARGVGNEGRFVRSGCRPNAVLRPVLCKGKGNNGRRNKAAKSKVVREGDLEGKNGKGKEKENEVKEVKEEKTAKEEDEDERMLSFGVFALRDLKANEEVVLGWEWDDGNAVHCLPALLSTPEMFP